MGDIVALQGKFVFIDTNIFEGLSFDWKNIKLDLLKRACGEKGIKLLVPELAKQEVEARIIKQLKKAKSMLMDSHRQVYSKCKILNALPQIKFSYEHEESKIVLIEAFNEYLNGCSAHKIPNTTKYNDEIFNMYFDGKAPFRANKKIGEFPDAFMLFSLIEYCRNERVRVSIVSGDKGVTEFANSQEEMQAFDSLDKYLEAMTWTYETELPELSEDAYGLLIEAIESEANDRLEGISVIVEDVAEYDIYVNGVKDIVLKDARLISLDLKNEHEVCSTFAIDIVCDLLLEGTYFEPDSWYKDDETKEIYYLEQSSISEYIEAEFSAVVAIVFSKENVSGAELESFALDDEYFSVYVCDNPF